MGPCSLATQRLRRAWSLHTQRPHVQHQRPAQKLKKKAVPAASDADGVSQQVFDTRCVPETQ